MTARRPTFRPGVETLEGRVLPSAGPLPAAKAGPAQVATPSRNVMDLGDPLKTAQMDLTRFKTIRSELSRILAGPQLKASDARIANDLFKLVRETQQTLE